MREPETDAEARLRGQIEAYHATALAYAAVKLGLPETMGADSWTAERLAAALDLDASHLFRTLRGLATLGLCEEGDGAFTLTDAGRALSPEAHSTLREKLLDRGRAILAAMGQSRGVCEDRAAGLRGNVRRARRGLAAVPSRTRRRVRSLSRGRNLRSKPSGRGGARPHLVNTIAEIGGGHGALLAALLLAHPDLHGILMDVPHKLAGARVYLQSDGLAGRVGLVGGDAALAVPVAADLYLLKSVLQQHEDETARAILANCRDAMPPDASLAVIERLMPETAAGDPAAVMLDLHMMAITGGRLRSLPEMTALLESAKLSVTGIGAIEGGLSLIRSVPR